MVTGVLEYMWKLREGITRLISWEKSGQLALKRSNLTIGKWLGLIGLGLGKLLYVEYRIEKC